MSVSFAQDDKIDRIAVLGLSSEAVEYGLKLAKWISSQGENFVIPGIA